MGQIHYNYQYYIGLYLIDLLDPPKDARILEIGCGEGGTIAAFEDQRYDVIGFDVSLKRIIYAKKRRLNVNIGDISDSRTFDKEQYDLVLMIDVLEHIDDKLGALRNLHDLIKDGGKAFISFPLKYSAYGGHQQNGMIMRYFPFVHLLPDRLIRFLFKRERGEVVESVIYNKHNGLTFRRFKWLCEKSGLEIVKADFYISRPVYKIRYGLPIIKNYLLRELSSGAECIVRRNV